MLFIKGFIIGLGKIMPGVSGAILAINFNVYERLIDAIIYFFDDWKNNLIFLFKICLGALLAIILGSKLLLILLSSYHFLVMMLFLGLIIGGTYDFGKNIKFTWKNIILIFFAFVLTYLFSLINVDICKIISGKMIYFMGGFVSIFASIVPGISSTAILMSFGIYDKILNMVANIYDINYLFNNMGVFLVYLSGMFISFIINICLINYLLKKYRDTTYSVIFALSIISIIFLLKILFELKITIISFIMGIILLVIGLLIATLLNKSVK